MSKEDLFFEDEMHIVEVNDTEIKIQELKGKEYMEALDQFQGDAKQAEDADKFAYAEAIIPECVIEPEEVAKNPDDLKAAPLMKILTKISEIHGTMDMMDEDFLER